MPIYAMKCDTCGNEDDIYRTVATMDDNLPQCCGAEMRRKICVPFVSCDIEPYQAMAVDVATGEKPIINSRRQHREYLQRNGYVEVGNEMPDFGPKEIEGDFDSSKELTQATREVLARHNA